MKDFFISYNKADVHWAKGLAEWLQGAGYSYLMQGTDFRAGSNFVLEMDKATKEAKRTIAVLSPDYLLSLYTQPEWAVAFAKDPTGERELLIPVKVRECTLTGLLATIVHINLVGLSVEKAHKKFLEEIQNLNHYNQKRIKKNKKLLNSLQRKKESKPTIRQTIQGDKNIQIGGDFVINKREVIKNIIKPGIQHIIEEQAYKIKQLIDQLSEMDVKTGRRDSHSKWYSKLYKRFKVTSYKTIPLEIYEEVVTWLHQQIAQERKKLRRANNTEWGKQHYTAIYARAKKLGLEKEQIYEIAQLKLCLKKPITSLKELGERNLKRLYNIIMQKK